MKPDDKRLGGDGPDAVLVFRHGVTAAEAQLHLPGPWRGQTESGTTLGIDLRILAPGTFEPAL